MDGAAMRSSHHIGVLRQIARFPVKSMQGELLPSAAVTLHGLAGDRRYAFVQTALHSSFPWFTAREMPAMLHYAARLADNTSGEGSVSVTTPSGETRSVECETLRRELEARSGRELLLLHDHRGSYDNASISLISVQTVARIAEESGTAPNARRFRPSLLVDLEPGGAFSELAWVGRVLRVGGAVRIAITEKDQRCMIIGLDPTTAIQSPSILRSVVSEHEGFAGVYAAVLTPGEVRCGDAIAMED